MIMRQMITKASHVHSNNPFIKYWFQNVFYICLTPCMHYRAKTGNIHSKFPHSQLNYTVYYLSPKYKSLLPKYLLCYNLEYGLAILTKGFSPFESELHNHP